MWDGRQSIHGELLYMPSIRTSAAIGWPWPAACDSWRDVAGTCLGNRLARGGKVQGGRQTQLGSVDTVDTCGYQILRIAQVPKWQHKWLPDIAWLICLMVSCYILEVPGWNEVWFQIVVNRTCHEIVSDLPRLALGLSRRLCGAYGVAWPYGQCPRWLAYMYVIMYTHILLVYIIYIYI